MIRRSAWLVATLAVASACHARDIGDAGRVPATATTRPASAAVLSSSFDPDALVPADTAAPHEHGATYTCTHHPEVREPKPGKCPKCGMDLVPAKTPEAEP